jgi:hypothetical protein
MTDVANRQAPPPQPPAPQPPEPGTKATQRIEQARLDRTAALATLAEAEMLLKSLDKVSVDIQIVIRERT